MRQRRWTLAAVLALLLLAAAAPSAPAAGDPTVFGPDCADPSKRPVTKCLNPTTLRDVGLSATSSTVTAGERITLTISGPPNCPGSAPPRDAPPCTRVVWAPLYGASPANWGLDVRKSLFPADVVGCNGNDRTCSFTVEYSPAADPARVAKGTALRVTAVVTINGWGCGTTICTFGERPWPNGGGWLDYKLRFQPGCGVSAARAAAASGCPDGIGWEMEDRTSEVPHIAGGSPIGMLRPKDIYAPLTVGLHLTTKGKRASRTCTRKSQWKWDVIKKPAGAKLLSKPFPGTCSSMQVSEDGAYTVRARRYEDGRLRQVLKKKIRVQDVLVVAMGDSNGSGEGAGPFWHEQCNRGSASYQYQAAHLLEQVTDLHASATFVSASCSGAIVSDLIDTRYAGIRPGPPLSPQIRQLDQRLAPPSGKKRRTVDAALVSIGVNNLGFGPILAYCIEHGVKFGTATPCEDTRVRIQRNAAGGVAAYVRDAGSPTTLRAAVNTLLRALPARYRELAKELRASGLVKPSRVFLTQYPSFFYGAGGALCTSQGGILGGAFSQTGASTWAWLAQAGNALNAAVRTAASAHGWNAVEVPRELFYGHGYCTEDSWFVSLVGAVAFNWNKAGAFHPSERGAHVTGVLTLRRLCKLLDDPRACGKLPAP